MSDDDTRFPWEEEPDASRPAPPPAATPPTPTEPAAPELIPPPIQEPGDLTALFGRPDFGRVPEAAPSAPSPQTPAPVQPTPAADVDPGPPTEPMAPPVAAPPTLPPAGAPGLGPDAGVDDATRVSPMLPGQRPPAQPTEYPEDWGEPTQAMTVPAAATGAAPPTSAVPTETGGLDSLFAAGNFREYDERLLPVDEPDRTAQEETAKPGLSPKTMRTIAWVGIGIVGVAVLVGLYVFGTRIPTLTASTPEPTSTSTEPTVPADGALPPGDYAFQVLRGGECIDPFPGAFEATYTVVDCQFDHTAQLVRSTPITDPVQPSEADLAARAEELCAVDELLDFTVAGEYDDLEVVASYPLSGDEWRSGASYQCFATRTSGEPLVGSLLASDAAPVEEGDGADEESADS